MRTARWRHGKVVKARPEPARDPDFGLPQHVHEGITQSRVRGLFTGGMLVVPLRLGEDARTVAQRLGLRFEERTNG